MFHRRESTHSSSSVLSQSFNSRHRSSSQDGGIPRFRDASRGEMQTQAPKEHEQTTLALETPAILERLLVFVDNPYAFVGLSPRTLEIDQQTKWKTAWIHSHQNSLKRWSAEWISKEALGPSTCIEWLTLLSAANDINDPFALVMTAESVFAGLAFPVFGIAIESPASLATTITLNATWTRQETACLQRALWRYATTKGFLSILSKIMATPQGLAYTTQIDMMKPLAFAAVQFQADPADTLLLSHVIQSIPNATIVLKDLHHFAIRLGNLSATRFLLETVGYKLGTSFVYLLNTAYQQGHNDLVKYLQESTAQTEEIAEAVQSWKTIMAINSVSPKTKATTITAIASALKARMKKATRSALLTSHWKSLLEIACAKGQAQLVQALLSLASDPELTMFNLQISLKMFALAVNGEFDEIAEMLINAFESEPQTEAALGSSVDSLVNFCKSPPSESSAAPVQIQGHLSLDINTDKTNASANRTVSSVNGDIVQGSLLAARARDVFLGNLPRDSGLRRSELVFRYCSTPNSTLFIVLFPQFHESEMDQWLDAVRLHRTDAVQYLLKSGSTQPRFAIGEECVWAAFQNGFVELFPLLQSAGGNFSWMESLSAHGSSEMLISVVGPNGDHGTTPGAAVNTTATKRLDASAVAIFNAYGGQAEASSTTSGDRDRDRDRARASSDASGDGGDLRSPVASNIPDGDSPHNRSATFLRSLEKLSKTYTLSPESRSTQASVAATDTSVGSAFAIGSGISSMSGSGNGNGNGNGNTRGTLSRKGTLLNRIVRTGAVAGSEDVAWTSFLAGKANTTTPTGASDDASQLSWMEPRASMAVHTSFGSISAPEAPSDSNDTDVNSDALMVYAALGGQLY